MKHTTIKKLQAFVGNVCTVLTRSVCKGNFTDVQFPDFFVGVIESIDEDGIFSRHPLTGCMNFFYWPHVVGVYQEQVIEETDPRYEKVMEEIKSSPEKKGGVVPVDMPIDISDNEEIKYLDPEAFNQIVKQANTMHGNKMVKKRDPN